MFKGRLFRSFYLRAALQVLAWEVVLVALSWLLYRQKSELQRFRFSDLLFLIGALEVMMASYGMLRSPFRVNSGPGGVPAHPVQDSEEQKRVHLLEEMWQQKSFAIRVTAIGLLTILLSVVLTYIIH